MQYLYIDVIKYSKNLFWLIGIVTSTIGCFLSGSIVYDSFSYETTHMLDIPFGQLSLELLFGGIFSWIITIVIGGGVFLIGIFICTKITTLFATLDLKVRKKWNIPLDEKSREEKRNKEVEQWKSFSCKKRCWIGFKTCIVVVLGYIIFSAIIFFIVLWQHAKP